MDTIKTFLAIAAIIWGAVILRTLPYNDNFEEHSAEALIAVILLAAGITYFWKHNRFAK